MVVLNFHPLWQTPASFYDGVMAWFDITKTDADMAPLTLKFGDHKMEQAFQASRFLVISPPSSLASSCWSYVLISISFPLISFGFIATSLNGFLPPFYS